MNRHRAIAVALVAAGAIVATGPAVSSAASSDPLGCAREVFDPSDLLDGRIAPAIAQAEQALDADVRVRAERSVDGGLDARIDQLVAQCDGWAAADGELADDMVVVLFSEVEREASVYYGADLGPDLESRWSEAIDDMTVEFPDSYSAGVVAALRTLRTETYSSSSSSSDVGSESSSGLIVVALIVIVALIAWGVIAKGSAAGGSYGFADTASGSRSWWSSGSSGGRRSSFGGFGSSSRSSSSGSSRSSSGGSHRAGGGTKKW